MMNELSIEEIEASNYSTNQVADLKMRLMYARKQLRFLENHHFEKGSELLCINGMYKTIAETLHKLGQPHKTKNCLITENEIGYSCDCGLFKAGNNSFKGCAFAADGSSGPRTGFNLTR